jgi:hypothetical protein
VTGGKTGVCFTKEAGLFVVYVTMLPVAQTIYDQMIGRLMYSELEII